MLYVSPKMDRPHVIEHDQWMITPDDVDYLAPTDRWCRVCTALDSEHEPHYPVQAETDRLGERRYETWLETLKDHPA